MTNELRMTRRLPATPAEIFRAWVDPDQVREWWGPNGMTTPVCEIEPRVGGRYRTVMRDAEGREYDNLGIIDELAEPRRIVMRMPEAAGGPMAGASVAVTLEPEAEGTRLDVRWQHPTEEMRAAHEAMGFDRGWGEMLDRLTAFVKCPLQMCPLGTPPTAAHGWLHRFLGHWDYVGEFIMPDGSTATGQGTEHVRSLGGYWVVAESVGGMPGGGEARCLLTLGFDAGTGRFTGNWVGSMMPHMTVYDGTLSEDGRVLTLESEGPSFTGEGTALYRDVLVWENSDHRRMETSVRGADGAWSLLMTLRHSRA
jgi:uncharacterized protein YndB with AHSA1/START domain